MSKAGLEWGPVGVEHMIDDMLATLDQAQALHVLMNCLTKFHG